MQRDTTALEGLTRRISQFCRAVYQHHEILVFRRRPADTASVLEDRLAGYGVEIRSLDIATARSAARTYPSTLTPAILQLFEDTLRNGDHGVMAVRGAELVHFSWVRTRTEIVTSELGPSCRLPLEAESAIVYHCWTAPSARGLGIYPHVLQRICRKFEVRAMDVWIYCSRNNPASLSGIERAGFSLTHSFTAHQFFGRPMFIRIVRRSSDREAGIDRRTEV